MSLNQRRRRAAAAARAAGVDALLVTHLPDVRYLCGFTGSNAALVLIAAPKLRAVLFTDGRYTAQARAEAAGVRVVISARPAVAAACAWMADPGNPGGGVTRCGFDRTQATVAALDAMRLAVAGVLSAKAGRSMFVAMDPVVAKLRELKDPGEIQTMRAAAALGCRLFERILTFIEPGMTELAVAAKLEYMARLGGAERMSFDTIVASGERSALPHGHATAARLPRRGFVTLDFGVVVDGYCSDMTRTVHLGRALPGEREAYDAVLEAQQAGVAAVRAGVPGSEVDEAARGVLRQAGLDEWFTHSTGHGVGLEIHERPRIARRPETPQAAGANRARVGSRTAKIASTPAKTPADTLKAGMVVTIEPGVYMPGKFGVRIEDTVVVTRTGCEVLTPSTKAWIEL